MSKVSDYGWKVQGPSVSTRSLPYRNPKEQPMQGAGGEGGVRFEILEPKSQSLQSRWKINADITLEKEAQRSGSLLASFASIPTRRGAALLREPGP